jgi:hypothetical protein
LVQGVTILAKISALIVCCLVLTKDSEAKPSIENVFAMAAVGSEVFMALQPELSTPFLLSEWLSDSGSGGFTENFSDEHRRMDEWETGPDR